MFSRGIDVWAHNERDLAIQKGTREINGWGEKNFPGTESKKAGVGQECVVIKGKGRQMGKVVRSEAGVIIIKSKLI